LSHSPWITRLRQPFKGLRLKQKSKLRGELFRPRLEPLEDRTLLSATTYLVNLVGDAGTGSGTSGDIRYCINQADNPANAGSTITFGTTALGSNLLTLTKGQLVISDNMTITGPGASKLTLSGNNSSRVFNISATTAQVTISGLTISGGSAAYGGGIVNLGSLTISDSTLSANSATISGGGICNIGGTLSVSGSSLSGNTASACGGGLYNNGNLTLSSSTLSGNSGYQGGAVLNARVGTLTVSNSTLNDNSAHFGAGLWNRGSLTVGGSALSGNTAAQSSGGIDNGGSLTVNNSTVAGNSAQYVGGLFNESGTATLSNATLAQNNATISVGGLDAYSGVVLLHNTLVAGNRLKNSSVDKSSNVAYNLDSASDYNLIGDGTGHLSTSNHNLFGSSAKPLDPLLAALDSYGGPTQTLALLPGSPAIDAGSSSYGGGTDQRGKSRVNAPDIGAFESQGFTIAVSTGDNQNAIVTTDSADPLVVSVTAKNAVEPVAGGAITFTAPATGASAVLKGNPATITNGKASVTAIANGTTGSYTVRASATGIASPVSFSLTNVPPTITLSGPSEGLVGSPVTWTATDSNLGTSPVYQFSVKPADGVARIVRDFSTSNSFVWNPMQEGRYIIQVTVKAGFSVTSVETTSTSYKADSRVTGTSAVVSAMSNPLVALLSAPRSSGRSMYVQFSPDVPNPTWQDTASQPIVAGESTNFIVAGMLPNTKYLMRDVIDNGTPSSPVTFRTGSLPSSLTFPIITVPRPLGPNTDLTDNMIFHIGGQSPTPSRIVTQFATDLAGNIDWYYDPVANNLDGTATRLVPGGMILFLGNSHPNIGGDYVLREMDLADDSLRETNVDAISAQLAALGKNPIINLNHEAQLLPNGDVAILAMTQRVIKVNGKPTTYDGDMVLVLDQNFQVKWAWDPFDWLDTKRLGRDGEGPDDWLHANDIGWSPEDGNLIVSLRAQDWVIKIDYSNGTGDGHIIWRLGAGGDFTAVPSDPSPWFSHQHDVRYINDNTIIVFDNGNTRRLTNPHADSRGQEWVLNEQTRTATLVVNADLGNYSSALGSAQVLSNGNLAFTSGYQGSAPSFFGQSIEVSPDGIVNYVQQMNNSEYRSYFVSSLYGGVNLDYGLLDSGFENPSQGTGAAAYQYDPAYSAWSYSGTAGVAGNGSAITNGNANAPEGSQVAFIQGNGTISQVVNSLVSGTYQLSLLAAQRAKNGTSSQTFEVEVDGMVVGTFTPRSTSYNLDTTNTFTLTVGTHTVTFIGLDPNGGDNTALLDETSIRKVADS
jgi:hypothetical protein